MRRPGSPGICCRDARSAGRVPRRGPAGTKAAHTEIQAIKIATPRAVERILDTAIQLHGAGGLSQDFPLASAYATVRTLRILDGPDEVHKNALARSELARHRP